MHDRAGQATCEKARPVVPAALRRTSELCDNLFQDRSILTSSVIPLTPSRSSHSSQVRPCVQGEEKLSPPPSRPRHSRPYCCACIREEYGVLVAPTRIRAGLPVGCRLAAARTTNGEGGLLLGVNGGLYHICISLYPSRKRESEKCM